MGHHRRKHRKRKQGNWHTYLTSHSKQRLDKKGRKGSELHAEAADEQHWFGHESGQVELVILNARSMGNNSADVPRLAFRIPARTHLVSGAR